MECKENMWKSKMPKWQTWYAVISSHLPDELWLQTMLQNPANIAVSMVGQRLRRWLSIETALLSVHHVFREAIPLQHQTTALRKGSSQRGLESLWSAEDAWRARTALS